MKTGVSKRGPRGFTRDFKLSVLKRKPETNSVWGWPRNWVLVELGCFVGSVPSRPTARLACCEKDPGAADRAEAAFSVLDDARPPFAPERRVAELERKIGEQQIALDFFAEPGCLSESDAGPEACLAGRHLRHDPGIGAATKPIGDGGLKWSSQPEVCYPSEATNQASPQAFSVRGFSGAENQINLRNR